MERARSARAWRSAMYNSFNSRSLPMRWVNSVLSRTALAWIVLLRLKRKIIILYVGKVRSRSFNLNYRLGDCNRGLSRRLSDQARPSWAFSKTKRLFLIPDELFLEVDFTFAFFTVE